jgi:hypothetical protein
MFSWTAPTSRNALPAQYEYAVTTSGCTREVLLRVLCQLVVVQQVQQLVANLPGVTSNTTYTRTMSEVCSVQVQIIVHWQLRQRSHLKLLCDPYTLSVTAIGFNAATITSCWSSAVVAPFPTSYLSYVATGLNPTTATQEGSNMIQYHSIQCCIGS